MWKPYYFEMFFKKPSNPVTAPDFTTKFCEKHLHFWGEVYYKHNHWLKTILKSYSKWIQGLNVRPDTTKFLEENIGRTLFDINHKILYDPPPRIMKIKTKINEWDLIKLKRLCTAKETINKMKRQPTEWEKIFASEVTDKGLISKIQKYLMQLYVKKNKQPRHKMGKRSK